MFRFSIPVPLLWSSQSFGLQILQAFIIAIGSELCLYKNEDRDDMKIDGTKLQLLTNFKGRETKHTAEIWLVHYKTACSHLVWYSLDEKSFSHEKPLKIPVCKVDIMQFSHLININ